jgi:predicted metalloprotease with PDZ domain
MYPGETVVDVVRGGKTSRYRLKLLLVAALLAAARTGGGLQRLAAAGKDSFEYSFYTFGFTVEGRRDAIQVRDVLPGSPAETSGLRPGFIVRSATFRLVPSSGWKVINAESPTESILVTVQSPNGNQYVTKLEAQSLSQILRASAVRNADNKARERVLAGVTR